MRRCAVALVPLFVLGACGGLTGPQLDALHAAERKWEAARPASNSYRMTQRVGCFCPQGSDAFEVTVTGGAISRAQNVRTGDEVPAAQFERFRTVAALFDELRAAIPRRWALREVVYDATLGFPALLSLDPIKDAIDDEVTYYTSNVVLLP